ncbi:hypothetical protein DLD77_05945 [Chitinophaga alhagiae]|uniref:Outer membrane protein beta-barrel domain-containing protein n=1 Tax=Chitinophaga alhagiae TaxID=2203219 RepID=A0ABM6WBI9_9BACT|nr:outer membrane beta-barrel protein [Chitinophaga alhagiae]AWO01263.1 hypothetical protein DLD77_05945 [Chitinophaga alhagiae]
MKKMIVMAVLGLVGTQFAKAQVQKGDFLVGGNVGVTSTTPDKVDGSDDKTTTTTFNISPKVGYALSDKWMVGVFVDAGFANIKDVDAGTTTKIKSHLIAPGIFVRNYHMLGESKVAIFGEANVSYGFGSVKADDTKTASLNTLEANVLPGITYFVTKRFMLEGVFGGITYRTETEKAQPAGTPKTTTSTFDFSFTKQFQVGVSWLF